MVSKRTYQRYFDKLSLYVMMMPGKSVGEGWCKYRAPDGNKCPIGYLLKDKYYDNKIEGASLRNTKRGPQLRFALYKSGVKSIFDDEFYNFLRDFQYFCHDSIKFSKKDRIKALKWFAHNYDLKYRVKSVER